MPGFCHEKRKEADKWMKNYLQGILQRSPPDEG